MKKQRESLRESELKDIFKLYKVTAKSIEGKGATAFIPDILCWDEEGNTFFIELKDGSTFSVGQLYLLKRLKNTYGCEYIDGNYCFYDFKGIEPVEITIKKILEGVKDGREI